MPTPEWDWRGLWIAVPRQEKFFLRSLIAGVFILAGWVFAGWLARYDFSEVLLPFTFQEESLEPIQERTIGHRTYVLELPVRWAFEVRTADLILPPLSGLLVAWFCTITGWGVLLALTTRLQGFWPYAVYFLWVAWVYLGKAALRWAGVDPFYVVSLGLSLVVLLPTYLIQIRVWNLPFLPAVLVLTVLVGGVLGLPALWKGWVVLHDAVAFPAVLTYAFLLLTFLQAAVGLLAGMTYFGYRYRVGLRGYGLLAAGVVGLGAALIFLPQDAAYTLALLGTLLGLLVGFVGLQPFYPVWGEGFKHPAAFFWGWAALLCLGLGGLGYHAWNHQDLFLYRAAQISWGTFLAGTVAVTLYLGVNFWPLWRVRQMTYWDLHRSMRMPLALVYFLQIGLLVLQEARNDWPSSRLPARLQVILQAEAALLAGDWSAAQAAYTEASLYLPYEAKLNYNLGRLEGQDSARAEAAAERYDRALLAKPFLPAAIQASLTWIASERWVRAIQLLQNYMARFGGHATLYNQLAFAFYKYGQLDSAAYYWKAALREAPAEPSFYLHLALLYARYGRPHWARTVARSAAELRSTSPAFWENLTYLRLVGVLDSLPTLEGPAWNAQWLGQETDTAVVGRFVRKVRQKAYAEALPFLPYFQQTDPELAPRLARYLAVHLLEEGMARRAAEFFLEAGTPQDSLYAAYAFGEAGCLDAAYSLASRLWVTYPALEEAGRREAALLLAASGHLQEALLLEPLSSWKDPDYLRFGQYAFLRGDVPLLVGVLRPWIEAGAAYDEPYEWVARLFLRQGDTTGAEENLEAGLQRVPASVRLRTTRGEVEFLRGHLDLARRWLDSAWVYVRSAQDSLQAEALALRVDFSQLRLETVVRRFPGYGPAQVLWARSLIQQGKAEEAYRYLGALLEVQPYDRALWEVYAQAAEVLGLREEADFARKKPDPCPAAL